MTGSKIRRRRPTLKWSQCHDVHWRRCSGHHLHQLQAELSLGACALTHTADHHGTEYPMAALAIQAAHPSGTEDASSFQAQHLQPVPPGGRKRGQHMPRLCSPR